MQSAIFLQKLIERLGKDAWIQLVTLSHLNNDCMVSVELKEVRMHAYHGIYPGESEHGGEFEVWLTVTYQENPQTDFSDLSQLVDYGVLYDIIRQRMMVPTPLIEKVAESIIRKIKHQYPVLHYIKLSIYKVSPPIPHFNGLAGITIEKNYED